jgi:hypothetical protein
MRRILTALALLLGLTLLAAHPASVVAAASTENRASGSAAVAEQRVGNDMRLSEEAVRENPSLRYDLASDSPVAAEGADAALAGGGDLTRAGRWMSPQEFDLMSDSGSVVEGGGGRTYVVNPPNPAAYTSAAPGSV